MRRVDELVSELQKVAQKYQKVTQKRLDEVNALIDSVEKAVEGVDEGTVENVWVEVDGKKFRFEWVCSNVGCWFRLSDESYRVFPSEVREIGSSMYLHQDFNCYVRFMDRETVVMVIRSWPLIVGQFLKKLEELTKEIENA